MSYDSFIGLQKQINRLQRSTYTAEVGGSYKSYVFNVMDYGAVGDGSTDDTTAIQNALDATSTAKGRCYLPPGNYKHTDWLTFGNNTELFGDGINVSVLKPVFSSAKQRVICNDMINGNTDITLRNFGVDRSGSNVTHGILFNGVTRLIIDSIGVWGVPSIGSGAIGISMFGATTYLETKDFRMTNCYLSDSDNFGVQMGFVQNCVVANNTFQDCYREVVGVEPWTGDTAKNITITGNTCVVNTVPASGTDSGCIIVAETSGGTVENVSVTGNTMINTNIVASNQNSGVSIYGGEGISVTGNTARDLNGSGIAIGGGAITTTGITISGNIVVNCNKGTNTTPQGSGIRLRNVQKSIVSNNYVYGTDHTHSVEETAGSADNMILNNYFQDTTPYGTLGTGTVYAGNKSITSNNNYNFLTGLVVGDVASPDGMAHIHTATAGSVTAGTSQDDLVVENDGNVGISLLCPDDKVAAITHGQPSNNTLSSIFFNAAGYLKLSPGYFLVLDSIKNTTGSPGGPQEGQIVINSYDGNIQMYANGGWRSLASWTAIRNVTESDNITIGESVTVAVLSVNEADNITIGEDVTVALP